MTTGSRRLAVAVTVLLSFAIALRHSLRAWFRSQGGQALGEPEAVARWHREGFRLHWQFHSRR